MKLAISRRWAIFIITSLLFVLSQFYRSSIAVITPQLMSDVSIDTKGLSLMSAAFFYAFALTQIPIGIYLDRIGPRKTMTVLSLVAVIGTLIFAWANSLKMLVLGRLLLGIGMACNLMGSFKLLTLWFGPLRFATLSALILSLGTAGNIAATTPLVLLVKAVDWRPAFTIIGAVNLLLAIIFFLVVRDRPGETPRYSGAPENSMNLHEILSDLYSLFAKKDYWIISIGTFCRYGVYAAVQTLWAGPYLMKARGLSAFNAGNLILLMNIGFILGGPFCGILSDKLLQTRKKIVIGGLVSLAAVLLSLAFLPQKASILTLAILFFSLGLVSSSGGLMYTHIKELMPIEKAGAAMTGINFFTMIGSAVFLQGLGNFMQHLYPSASLGAQAFKDAFLLCATCLAFVSFLYFFTRDTLRKGKNL